MVLKETKEIFHIHLEHHYMRTWLVIIIAITKVLANSFKINFLENNRIYSAFLTYGVCYGEGIYTSVDYKFSDIYTFRKPFISISYMYGIYDITKISFFQKYSKLNLFEYFKISPSVTYSMHRMEDLEPRIPFEGTLLIGVKVNFIKLGFLFPYLQYEKAIGLVNDRYTYGLFFIILQIKKIKEQILAIITIWIF